MTYLNAILALFPVLIIAVLTGRLIQHFCRRLNEDKNRIQAATDALLEQGIAIEDFCDRDSVPNSLKKVLLDISQTILDRDAAHFFVHLVEHEEVSLAWDSPEEAKRFQEFQMQLDELALRDKEAREILNTATRRALVAAILQWPETTKSIARLSLRMAAEKQSAPLAPILIQKGLTASRLQGRREAYA